MNDIATLGMIRLWCGNYLPQGFAWCDGSLLPTNQYGALFQILGTTFGGDGLTTFRLPDLQDRIVVGAGQGPELSNYNLGQQAGSATVGLSFENLPSHDHTMAAASANGSTGNPSGNSLAQIQGKNGRNIYQVPGYAISGEVSKMELAVMQDTGGGEEHDNLMPYQTFKYIICTDTGVFANMVGVVGQIMIYAGMHPEANQGQFWKVCDGSSMISGQYPQLFQEIAYTYGGSNGVFNLPDLRSCTVLGTGEADNIRVRVGERHGVEFQSLSSEQIPAHNHLIMASPGGGNSSNPANAVLAAGQTNPDFFPYSSSAPNTLLNDNAVAQTGYGQGHYNVQPCLGLHYLICVNGVSPSPQGAANDYLGMLAISAGIPDGSYLPCDGSLLPEGNPELHGIIGHVFDPAQQKPILPNLQVAVPMGCSNMSADVPGETGGAVEVAITEATMASHVHQVFVNMSEGTSVSPDNLLIAPTPGSANLNNVNIFADSLPANAVSLHPNTVGMSQGTGKPHLNMQPFVALNYSICNKGTFPSRT